MNLQAKWMLGPMLLGAQLLGLPAAAGSFDKPPEPLIAALDTITDQDVVRHEEFLTSKECAGRDTPSAGLERAAVYLIEQYKKLGIAGAADANGYLYPFEVPVVSYQDDDHLAVLSSDGTQILHAFVAGEDFVPVRGSASGDVEGELLFAGYGIRDPGEGGYDDFRNVDVKDRIVLLMTHEPRENKKGGPFKGEEPTDHSRIDRKGLIAQELGARAVLVVTDPLQHDDLSVLPAEHPRFRRGPHRIQPQLEVKIPVVHISGEVADALVTLKSLKDWQTIIDKKMRGEPRRIEGIRIKLKVDLKEKQQIVHNVVAAVPGKNPALNKEWIVIGAHYDHIGMDPFGRIYHGADDNASGTACLLEISEALSRPGVELSRSVMFIHFAGEEKGLVGAFEYCKKPLHPLEDTVLMINMDMVGRGRPDEIDAVGLTFSDDLETQVRKAASMTRARLKVGKDGMQYFHRSDQLAFWQKGVPVLFFMEPKEHPDYHQVTDTMDKVDMKKVAKVARLVSGLTYIVSEMDRRPIAKTGKDSANESEGQR